MPPAWRSRSAGRSAAGPRAMLIRPSRPKRMAPQPTTCRPAGPLWSGWRSVRQAIAASRIGASADRPPMMVETPMSDDVAEAARADRTRTRRRRPRRGRGRTARRRRGEGRVELPGAVADGPDRGADPVGQPAPDRDEAAQDRGQQRGLRRAPPGRLPARRARRARPASRRARSEVVLLLPDAARDVVELVLLRVLGAGPAGSPRGGRRRLVIGQRLSARTTSVTGRTHPLAAGRSARSALRALRSRSAQPWSTGPSPRRAGSRPRIAPVT